MLPMAKAFVPLVIPMNVLIQIIHKPQRFVFFWDIRSFTLSLISAVL